MLEPFNFSCHFCLELLEEVEVAEAKTLCSPQILILLFLLLLLNLLDFLQDLSAAIAVDILSVCLLLRERVVQLLVDLRQFCVLFLL